MIASVLAIFWIFSLFARYREEEILGMSKSRHKKLQYFAQLCCGGLTSNFSILSKKNVAGVTVETLCNILKGNMQIAFLILGKFCSSVICGVGLFVFSLTSCHRKTISTVISQQHPGHFCKINSHWTRA